ncbi:MAG: hypothetical protein GKS06_11655 [Acidobacteria bacterium]|nr:hypothetical protein [Acidobacteriota bacterium]
MKTSRLVLRFVAVALVGALCLSHGATIQAAGNRMEKRAKQIGKDLKRRHLPTGTVFDPVFAGPGSKTIVGYQHAGDSAIWTGHWIAAEAFRYAVTGKKDARNNVRKALKAIRLLVDVTGADVLARGAVPSGSRWEDSILVNEARHGTYRTSVKGKQYIWAGNTSRDQYSGVFFGMGFAWELMPNDPVVRNVILEITDRLLGNLINNAWTVEFPDGTLSTSFAARPDQMLAFLQIGRMVKPDRFDKPYRDMRGALGHLVKIPIDLEATDPHGSYFKFNLDHINLVHLLRLEEESSQRATYRAAFDKLRETVGAHDNAHFNMIERVLNGGHGPRDRRTRDMLKDWLERPRRITSVDLSGSRDSCGDNRACNPIPVVKRVPTDFLWQRSPFDLKGGGNGTIEGAGLDYLLPYWMARYYRVI